MHTRASTILPITDSAHIVANSFVETSCFAALGAAQNADGGWGFRCGQSSAVEPTSWALLATAGLISGHPLLSQARTAADFLRGTQLSDGSWPTAAKDQSGGWVTSLACLALGAGGGAASEVEAGLHWLSRSWPGEGGLWWRIRYRVFGRPDLARQDHRLRGWSWTRGTSSWVEPTAYALLALRAARGSASFLARVDKRCNLAHQMLRNRMCPGGGWNCGNPFVYGAAGNPLIGPTSWALFALGEFARHDEVRRCVSRSLEWLEQNYLAAEGPASLALAYLCLRTFDRKPVSIDSQLEQMYRRNQFMGSVPALAWASLTAQDTPRWLAAAGAGSN